MKLLRPSLHMGIISCLEIILIFLTPGTARPEKGIRDFGFNSIEIYQFKEKTSNLTLEDLNHDGLDDILFLNNRMSRVEVLIRKPEACIQAAESSPDMDSAFINQGFLINQLANGLLVLDADKDGRLDLLVAGKRSGISIFFQLADGSFKEKPDSLLLQSADLTDVHLSDFNADSHMDLLVNFPSKARIFYQSTDGRFISGKEFTFSDRELNAGFPLDANGDGWTDILFYFPKNALPLRLYLGDETGEFSWEHALDLPDIKDLKPFRNHDETADSLTAIFKNALNIRCWQFKENRQTALFGDSRLTPLVLAMKGGNHKIGSAWAIYDVDANGFDDLCLSAPELSRILIFLRDKNGLNPVPREIETLKRIKTMGINSRQELYVFSPEEKAVAVHTRLSENTFPRFLQLKHVPVAMGTSPFSENTFLITEDQDGELYFEVAGKNPDTKTVVTFPADTIPDSLTIFPINDNRWGVICFIPYGNPLMFIWNGSRLDQIPQESFRALGNELTRADLAIAGTPEDPALLVCESGVARLYRYANNEFTVEKQYSLDRSNARLTFGTPYPGPAGNPGFLVFDAVEKSLHWFDRKGGTVLDLAISETGENLDACIPFNSSDSKGLLFLSPSETRLVLEGARQIGLKTLADYTSPSEEPHLWQLFPIDLGNPPRRMMAALDANNATIECIEPGKDKLINLMTFKVFQSPGFRHENRKLNYEPREICTGDINGDGIQDMAVLVHDRLILYSGE